MKEKVLALILVFGLVTVSNAEFNDPGAELAFTSGPPLQWQQTFGGDNHDAGYSVQQTSDGGYIITGSTSSYGTGSSDVYLIKTDSNGNKKWQKTYGGTDSDGGWSVQQTSDDGYIITGHTYSSGAMLFDVYLIKTDPNGNSEWQKTIGGSDYERANSVQQTSDGGYIIGGWTESYGAGSQDVYLIKTEPNGNSQWQRTFGGSETDEGHSVQQTLDGGYIIGGFTRSYGAGYHDVYLIKTDPNGNSEWQKTFGGEDYDEGYSVQQTSDGGYIIAGYTESYGTGSGDVYLIKTDPNGNGQWHKTFGGSYFDWCHSIQQTTDGGYIIAGSTGPTDGRDVYLIKTDPNGNSQWQRTFGGSDYDAGYSVQQTSDGGYIIVGRTRPYDTENDDVYLLKVFSDTHSILYVDADATGANNGSSWANAFNDLQDALAEAHYNVEIRVAQGIYTPESQIGYQASNPIPPNGATGVSTKSDLSWTAGLDTVSHDVYFGTSNPPPFILNQTSTTFDPCTMDYYTTYYWRIDSVSIWDKTTGEVWSFTTIMGPPPPYPAEAMSWGNDQGAEVLSEYRTATFQLKNSITIKGGYAGFGETNPNAHDIEAYETILSGDIGIPGDNSDNSYHVVTSSGLDETAVLDGFTITCGNANGPYPHDQGGGIFNERGNPTLINCTISGNSAGAGGGIYNCDYSKLIISNCTFTGNIANWFGGGMMSWEADSTLTNCTFHGNLAQRDGNALACASPAAPRKLEATNCIFWDGGHEICDIYGNSTIKVTYSNVQGGWPDQGNIYTDPRFITFGYWGDADNPDIIVEPNHAGAVWVNGDYHLKSEGWRWYTLRNTWMWDDITSKCVDAGNPGSLLREELLSAPADPDNNWGRNLRINMGRYGGTARASIPPYGWSVLADLTNDGLVDFVDLSHWVEIWLSSSSEQPSDLDRNGTVDFADFSLFAQDWRAEAMWPPGRASNPNPADGATDVSRASDLSWTAGDDVTSHDVYFGTTNPPPFVRNQTSTTFDPGVMDGVTKYYWRVDEVNKWSVTNGDVWDFTTRPTGKPIGCFTADTPVWIDGAQVQFSKVAAGQKVGRPDVTDAESCFEKPVCLKEIERVLEYQGTYDYYYIVLESGNRINVVHSHYFLTATDRWVLVQNLKAGSKLQSLNGPISIKTITKRDVPFTGRLYNLKIKGGDRYFVGKDGVVVRGH